jgi:hypothetical protein
MPIYKFCQNKLKTFNRWFINIVIELTELQKLLSLMFDGMQMEISLYLCGMFVYIDLDGNLL